MVTMRRRHLDQFLAAEAADLSGLVLDIGGKKRNRRGNFVGSENDSRRWLYLNIDPGADPDYLCSAENIPLPDASVDVFILCEVLEHAAKPEALLAEAHRILRCGGTGLLTMPFLVQVHADPEDYQRWTRFKLCRVLEETGFQITHVHEMGSIGSVIHDLLHAAAHRSDSFQHATTRRLGRAALRSLYPAFRLLDVLTMPQAGWITTGWAVRVQKRKDK